MADWMVELGPESGEHGGRVVFAGPMSDAAKSPLTGKYLTGERTIPLPEKRRKTGPRWIRLTGAREHNLRGVDIRIPDRRPHRRHRASRAAARARSSTTSCSGRSSSGSPGSTPPSSISASASARSTSSRGYESLDAVVLVDQEPIGRSPRSNPVTYIKAFDEIRRIFADVPLAKQTRYTASTFSFNVKGGRCEKCEGAGYIEVEMVFMADVYVPCEECDGTRYKPEVLDVKYLGQEHRRSARPHGGRGDPVLPEGGEARPGALAGAAGGARLPAARPARDDAVRRRGAAAEDRARTHVVREDAPERSCT